MTNKKFSIKLTLDILTATKITIPLQISYHYILIFFYRMCYVFLTVNLFAHHLNCVYLCLRQVTPIAKFGQERVHLLYHSGERGY